MKRLPSRCERRSHGFVALLELPASPFMRQQDISEPSNFCDSYLEIVSHPKGGSGVFKLTWENTGQNSKSLLRTDVNAELAIMRLTLKLGHEVLCHVSTSSLVAQPNCPLQALLPEPGDDSSSSERHVGLHELHAWSDYHGRDAFFFLAS